MADSNIGKPKNVSKENWDKKIREEARKLYERGIDIAEISSQMNVPYQELNDWKFVEQWEVLPEPPEVDNFPISLDKVEEIVPVLYDDDDITLSTVKANERLLNGFRLVQQVAQDAVLNDSIKFKDKKQASDALIDSLKGEVAVLGVDLSQQFLLDIAQIIREEVKDEETLQRLGERLVAIGRLYNARITAQRN